jgi:flagellar protein FlgJ
LSIQPPSDIVLDVANAADPAKALAATERLARLGGVSVPVQPGAFESVLGATAQSTSEATLRTQLAKSGEPTDVVNKPIDPRAKAYKGLEALVLQNLVETMLPKDAGSFFGKEAGGDQWRSMLAQKIGEQMSKRMDLGIASKAAAIHMPSDKRIPTQRDAMVDQLANVTARGARL